MRSTPVSFAALSAALFSPCAFAQDAPGQAVASTPAPLAASDLFVPIHTQPADPAGGEYGWWAGSAGYKASFHTGFVFYPFVGPSSENLPFAWTRTRATVGGHALIADGMTPAHRHAANRYEYVYPGGLVEAYDVKVEGIEQTFTIQDRPQHGGEIVVSGTIASSLRAAEHAGHGRIEFKDALGNARVVYGEAWAIDAAGNKIGIETTYDGSSISLRVPAAFVAEASFPLTIDPLTTPVIIANYGGTTFGLAQNPAIGRDDESSASNIMTFYSRQFSASDSDGYARLTNNDYSNSSLIYTDITTSWSTIRAGVASVGGANRWTLCLQRVFSTLTNVRVYLHDFGSTVANSGATLFHTDNTNTQRINPEIGGTASYTSGTKALLVFQYESVVSGSAANTEVYGCLVDASGNGSIGADFLLSTGSVGTTFDRELPTINQESAGGTASWVVGWQELNRSLLIDDWDFMIARITSTGTVAGISFLGPATSTGDNKYNVRIAGREGRYMGSYLVADGSTVYGKEFQVERFDWAENATQPVKHGWKTVAKGGAADYYNGAIAFDTLSDSHWALTYQRGGYTTANLFVVRVGYTGGVVETQTLYAQPSTGAYSPSITFDDDSRSFMICYASTENAPSGLPVFGVTLNYANAQNVAYGTGCGPAVLAANRRPFAGDEFYAVSVSSLPPLVPVTLFVSASSASVPLTALGMPGCFLNVGVTTLASIPGAATTGGMFTVKLPLPDDPAVIGNAYLQCVYGHPAAPWAFKVATTQGLRAEIR